MANAVRTDTAYPMQVGTRGSGPILRELGRPGEPRGKRRGQTRVHPTSQVTVNTLDPSGLSSPQGLAQSSNGLLREEGDCQRGGLEIRFGKVGFFHLPSEAVMEAVKAS